MRRTTTVPCLLGRMLLMGLVILGACAVSAQDNVPVLVIPINTTKQIEMTKKQIIAEVRNENPKVCRVQTILNNPNAVLITGLAPGTSRLTFTDNNKVTETVDVTVSTESRAEREALRKEFLEKIAKTVPSAKIDVLITDKTTIITGTAPDLNSQRVIMDTAKNTFGNEVVNAVTLPGQEPEKILPRVQQVELEVLVAVVNRSEIRKMTFNWVESRQNYFVSSLLGSPLAFANSITTSIAGAAQAATGTPNMNFGVVGDRHSFSAFLEALRTEGLAKVLSEPRITTLSGQRANILSGGETPLLTTSGQGSPTIEYKSFGTEVLFTPVVLENGKIQLDVEATLSNRNDANGIFIAGITPTTIPGFDTRRARAVVQIESSQTLAIGGLIQNSVNASVKKVPILGDIPFFGAAFSSTSYDEREEEMLILVTPRLVNPMDCTQLPRRMPGRETRSPDDFELFLTQILEAPRGQREVCPDGRFRAAHRNGPTSGIYPCGDNSQSWNRGGCGLGAACGQSNCGHTGGNCSSGRCGSPAPQPVRQSLLGDLNNGHVQVLHTSPYQQMPTGPATSTMPVQITVPAGLPLSEAPLRDAAPALPSDFPSTETRPVVPASLGPIGNDDNR